PADVSGLPEAARRPVEAAVGGGASGGRRLRPQAGPPARREPDEVGQRRRPGAGGPVPEPEQGRDGGGEEPPGGVPHRDGGRRGPQLRRGVRFLSGGPAGAVAARSASEEEAKPQAVGVPPLAVSPLPPERVSGFDRAVS